MSSILPTNQAQSPSVQMSLAAAVGLQPLDRVEINSAKEIRESRAFSRQMNTPAQHLYYYFQKNIVGV